MDTHLMTLQCPARVRVPARARAAPVRQIFLSWVGNSRAHVRVLVAPALIYEYFILHETDTEQREGPPTSLSQDLAAAAGPPAAFFLRGRAD